MCKNYENWLTVDNVIAITRAVLSQGGPRDAAVNFDKKIYNGIARFLCHSTAFL